MSLRAPVAKVVVSGPEPLLKRLERGLDDLQQAGAVEAEGEVILSSRGEGSDLSVDEVVLA